MRRAERIFWVGFLIGVFWGAALGGLCMLWMTS